MGDDPVPTTTALLRRERLLVRSAAILLTLLFLTTGGSIGTAWLALDARDTTSDKATARITGLQNDLRTANAGITEAQSQNAELLTKVEALAAQIEQLGAKPVVTPTVSTTVTTVRRAPAAPGRSSSTTSTTSAPAATTTTPPAAPTSTTTTTRPTSPTTTSPCRGVLVAGTCIGG